MRIFTLEIYEHCAAVIQAENEDIALSYFFSLDEPNYAYWLIEAMYKECSGKEYVKGGDLDDFGDLEDMLSSLFNREDKSSYNRIKSMIDIEDVSDKKVLFSIPIVTD